MVEEDNFMHYREQVQERVRNITREINYYINFLYVIPCMFTRNMVLNLIRDRLSMLDFLFELLDPYPICRTQ